MDCIFYFINRLNSTDDSQTMPKDKLERASESFGCLVSEEHYQLANPLQDKCYIFTKIINKFIQKITCASCIKEKVNELNAIHGITKKHYDVSESITITHMLLGYNCFRTDTADCHHLATWDLSWWRFLPTYEDCLGWIFWMFKDSFRGRIDKGYIWFYTNADHTHASIWPQLICIFYSWINVSYSIQKLTLMIHTWMKYWLSHHNMNFLISIYVRVCTYVWEILNNLARLNNVYIHVYIR